MTLKETTRKDTANEEKIIKLKILSIQYNA